MLLVTHKREAWAIEYLIDLRVSWQLIQIQGVSRRQYPRGGAYPAAGLRAGPCPSGPFPPRPVPGTARPLASPAHSTRPPPPGVGNTIAVRLEVFDEGVTRVPFLR